MTRPARLAALLLGLAAPVPAQAQDLDCSNPVTQLEMNQCAYEDWQAADAALNLAYKDAMAMLKDWDEYLEEGDIPASDALRDAQRAWITFRDKACEAEGYAMRGGSAEPLLVNGCLARLTNERTTHLRDLVEGYGGL